MTFLPPDKGPIVNEFQKALDEVEKKTHPVRYWAYVIIMLALLAVIGIGYLMGHSGNPVPGPNPTTGGHPVIQTGNPLGPG